MNNPRLMPAAITFFHKETLEKKANLRRFIGLNQNQNQYKNTNVGQYGVNSYATVKEFDNDDYVPCLEKGCTFKGPIKLIELHTKMIHEKGYGKEIDLDIETFIKNRKKNFPSYSKKYEPKILIDMNEKPVVNETSSSKLIKTETTDSNSDLLGLCASNGSSDKEELHDNKTVCNKAYYGLPLLKELNPKTSKKRLNKCKFPFLPQMELTEKRRALMNPNRRYLETSNRKAKRPRLSQILCAEDLLSERNVVLQCIRYMYNKRFFDASLSDALVDSVQEPANIQLKQTIEDEDIFKMVEVQSDDDDNIVWSDCDL